VVKHPQEDVHHRRLIFIFNQLTTMGETIVTIVGSLRGTLAAVLGTTFQPFTSS